MLKKDLSFSYPEELVATETKNHSRVMWVQEGHPTEVSVSHVMNQIEPEDLLVINETRVIPARIFSEEGIEVLFINAESEFDWKVLCPVRKWPKGKKLKLPNGVQLELIEKGLPARVRTSTAINTEYLNQHGEMPLPPYIQQARGERHTRPSDKDQYQTQWARIEGSLAAPTASLHFSNEDIEKVKDRGAAVEKVCLHVGLGTFLPIHCDNLDEHKMHQEFVHISDRTWEEIQKTKKRGGRIWALGSTVTRALESKAVGIIEGDSGNTDLFIKPGFDFKVVDVLMTNFHQPESTLIAMVMAFAGEKPVKNCYQWAIERQFRLFSYGDLSVWLK